MSSAHNSHVVHQTMLPARELDWCLQPMPAPAPLPASLHGVDFTPTVLGLPPDHGYVKWPWSELGPVPAGFDPPAIPSITFYGLAGGTPLPPLLSGNSYVQVSCCTHLLQTLSTAQAYMTHGLLLCSWAQE